jgi:hypothetical protein
VRHAINLAGILIGQTLVFSWVHVPVWVTSKSLSSRLTGSQFQIADVLGMTTAFACLLGLATRYEPQVQGRIYWPVLVLICCATPILSGSFALAALAQSRHRALSWAVFGLVMVAGLGLGVAIAEDFHWRSPLTEDFHWRSPVTVNLIIALQYATIFVAFGATSLTFGLAGRIQTLWQSSVLHTDAARPLRHMDDRIG